MKKNKVRNLHVKKYFPLFAIAAIVLAIPATVLLSQQIQTLQQNAACLGNHLHIGGPVQLDATTIPVGGTIHGTVTYTNEGRCDVYVRDMAIAGRPPGAPQSDPNNQYGKYAFLPEKFNFTMHPGQSITMTGSLTIQQGWPKGQGWYSYAAYQTGDGNWHGNDNPKVYFTVTGSGAGGSVCTSQFQGTCMNTSSYPYQCPSGYQNMGNIDCGTQYSCCVANKVYNTCQWWHGACTNSNNCSIGNSKGQLDCSSGQICCTRINGGSTPTPVPNSCAPQGSCTNNPSQCPAGTTCYQPGGGCYPMGCPHPF